ncbi:MAG: dodecin domain-containing protein [Hyphomicrobiaceae bacterium]|nr:dodecin domain-containing protein [Hyphomicrobiaceae bacterium]MCC0009071.1 dodecin domain-containing protein [Hyphomicrobiaceae bacterium]
MSVNKVIELMAESDKSWEDAAEKAVKQASKSVKGIKSIWIKDFAATVDDKGKLQTYRITAKVSFEVMD